MRYTSKKARQCHGKIMYAVKRLRIRKHEYCAICGINPSFQMAYDYAWVNRPSTLVAHHWRGYDFPLDVWYVCQKCNARLRLKHDGSLPTTEEAFLYLYHSWQSHISEMRERLGLTVIGGEPPARQLAFLS